MRPRIVRCEGEVAWKRVSGNELCREREGGRERGRRGEAGGTPGRWATSRGAERPRGSSAGFRPARGHRTPSRGSRPGRPRPARGPARPAAWHGSKRAPDCYALCFLLRSGAGGMGLASCFLPRGGGTLKGQRPLLPAAARCRLRPPHLPAARLTPFPETTGGRSRARGERARAEASREATRPHGARGACRGAQRR